MATNPQETAEELITTIPQQAAEGLIAERITLQRKIAKEHFKQIAKMQSKMISAARAEAIQRPDVTYEEIKDLVTGYIKSWREFNLKDLAKSGLASGATIATAFMSFAGAVALGATLPFAITAMVLTALVSFQVNKEITDAALNELEIFFLGIKHKLFPKPDAEYIPAHLTGVELKQARARLDKIKNAHLKRDTVAIALSVLAAISFCATSLYAAAALFTFNVALAITIMCLPAMFLMSFNILADSWRIIKHDILGSIFRKSRNTAIQVQTDQNGNLVKPTKTRVEKSAFQKLAKSLKNASWFRYSFTLALCAAMTVLTLYYAKATWSTWWVETGLGLLLAYPALFLSIPVLGVAVNFGKILRASSAIVGATVHSLFIMKNSLEAILKSSANLDAAISNKSPLFEKIKSTPALKYNPAFWANLVIAKISSGTLFLLHSLCHSLMGSRDWSVIAGTVTDLASDLNFISDHHHGEGEHAPHGHEPWDFIVMSFQFVVLTAPFVFPLLLPISLPLVCYFPIALGSVAWHFVQNRISNPAESWKTQLWTSVKDTYFFVSDYVKSKRCHSENNDGQVAANSSTGCANDTVYSDKLNPNAQSQPNAYTNPSATGTNNTKPHIHSAKQNYGRSRRDGLGVTSCMQQPATASSSTVLAPYLSTYQATPDGAALTSIASMAGQAAAAAAETHLANSSLADLPPPVRHSRSPSVQSCSAASTQSRSASTQSCSSSLH